MAPLPEDFNLSVTVQRFEGKFAVLETDDGQTLRWPIKQLPDDAQEGARVRLSLTTPAVDETARQELARAVLNTLLSGT